jgi:hypothetical protein
MRMHLILMDTRPRHLIESRFHLHFALQSEGLSSANLRTGSETITMFDICSRHRRRRSKPLLFLILLTSDPANAGLDHELGYDEDGLCRLLKATPVDGDIGVPRPQLKPESRHPARADVFLEV